MKRFSLEQVSEVAPDRIATFYITRMFDGYPYSEAPF